jgi:hypothetical protein
MPTTVYGIGTWYCGKDRVHRLRSGCRSCRAVADLESFDTTLCVVVFRLPVLPLGSKRILNACPVCQRHRAVGLTRWEADKAEACADLLDRLRSNPNDRETIVSVRSRPSSAAGYAGWFPSPRRPPDGRPQPP